MREHIDFYLENIPPPYIIKSLVIHQTLYLHLSCINCWLTVLLLTEHKSNVFRVATNLQLSKSMLFRGKIADNPLFMKNISKKYNCNSSSPSTYFGNILQFFIQLTVYKEKWFEINTNILL